MKISNSLQTKDHKYVRLIRFLYYTLFVITPFIMFSGTSELFEFNKMITIYTLVTCIGAIWTIGRIKEGKPLFQYSKIYLPFIIFFLTQLASTVRSIDIHTSLFGYYGRFNGGLVSLIAFYILAYVCLHVFDTKMIKKLLSLSVLTSAGVMLWGLPGRVGYDMSCFVFTHQLGNSCWTDQFRPAERMFSTLGQPNWLGAYLAIHFCIGLYFLVMTFIFRKQNEKEHSWLESVFSNSWITSVYIVLTYICILFTRSRSALVSVYAALGIFIVLLLFFERKKAGELFRSNFVYLTAILLLFSTVIFKTGIGSVDRILSFQFKTAVTSSKQVEKNPAAPSPEEFTQGITESFDIRKIVWDGAIKLGMKNPVFGTGVETFAYAYYMVRPRGHNLTTEWDFLYNKAHNEYLNFFATTGFLGIGSYLLLIGSVLGFAFVMLMKKSLDHTSDVKVLIISLISAYSTILITNFFGFSTSTINLFFYGIPVWMWIYAGGTVKVHENKIVTSPLQKNVSILFISASALYILFSILCYFQGDLQYSISEVYTRSGEFQKAAQSLDVALKWRHEHVYEDKLSYALANIAYAADYQKEKDTADKLRQLAEYYNLKSLKASPSNVLYWKTRAKDYYLFYQMTLKPEEIQEAIRSLDEAKKLSPTDPKIPYSLAIFYSLLEDESKDKIKKTEFMEKSIEGINEAIYLKPDYRDSYSLKGQLMKKFGRIQEAKDAFTFILEKINPLDVEAKKELESL